MYGRGEKSSFFPKLGECSGGLLWKVHCVALESEASGVQSS